MATKSILEAKKWILPTALLISVVYHSDIDLYTKSLGLGILNFMLPASIYNDAHMFLLKYVLFNING